MGTAANFCAMQRLIELAQSVVAEGAARRLHEPGREVGLACESQRFHNRHCGARRAGGEGARRRDVRALCSRRMRRLRPESETRFKAAVSGPGGALQPSMDGGPAPLSPAAHRAWYDRT